MALHGSIMINGQPIGGWSATRVTGGTDPDDVNTYNCEVWMTSGARFCGLSIRHRYGDGALALASQVIAAATREVLTHPEVLRPDTPWVIENVADARSELRSPILLCGRQFGLTATDDDGTPLVMDRHRLFESNAPLMAPEHPKHDKAVQVAGSYGGARRDKREAREVRKGGYVPSADVQRQLLGTPWMSEKGCQLSIPPVYAEFIGDQLLDLLARSAPHEAEAVTLGP